MLTSAPYPWSCPVCQLALICGEHRWYCENNHSFDVAKSGYSNLLLANHKASKQPGDSPAMLQARRHFLAEGHFEPIVAAIADELNNSYTHVEANHCKYLLDIGCGEGYYLSQLLPRLHHNWQTAGLDIAKTGVQMAAKRHPKSIWVCASSARIPVLDHSLNALLRIFAPSDAAQSHRVLGAQGVLITVTPAARHLYELKRALYDSVRLHEKAKTPENFELQHEREVNYEIHLTHSEDINSLLSMTPFLWRGQQTGRASLLQREQLRVQVSVTVSVYRPL